MKLHLTLALSAIVSAAMAAEAPDVFSGLLKPGVAVRGQIGMVLPPLEIDKYDAKMKAAREKDPKWFREYAAKSKPGVPLPFDERLGLTREEYDEYIALWNKREFKPMDEVMLLLREAGGGTWAISATGRASALSTLRYSPADDTFRSPNGELKRIEDINADPSSILGAWTGKEWKFEEEHSLGKTKENFAIGRMADGKFGLVVYRVQDVPTEGTSMYDNRLVIRFPLDSSEAAKAEEKKKPVLVKPKK